MRTSIISSLLIISLTMPLGTGLCYRNDAKNGAPAPESGIEMEIAQANNQFGFDLFNQLKQQDKGKNIFFSPLSVAFALAMTYNGAGGATKEEMQRVLKLTNLNHDQINEESAALMKKLGSSDPQIELAIANSLWGRKGEQFKEEFLAGNHKYFGAEIASLDFADPKSKSSINNWVNKNTKGKIPAIVDQIDSQMVLYLINAIYFKGLWTKKFNKELTKDAPFNLVAGSQKQVPMMSQSGEYRYYRGDRFQAVNLPYGKGGAALYLFLPDQGSSLDDLLNEFSRDTCAHWLGEFRNAPGDVKIPRFKMDYEKSLNNALLALGMKTAFSSNHADFGGMIDKPPVYLSEVKHKAIVEVNEEGTEAAAATSVGVRTTALRRTQERFTFIADHPFLMIIRDEPTGAILFMGTVVEPK